MYYNKPMPDIAALARQKAEATGHDYMAWLNAFSECEYLATEAHLGKPALAKLTRACHTPDQFSLMVEAFDQHAKENPQGTNGFDLLAEQVDASPYALGDWIAALETFYSWLSDKRRHAAFQSMLGYLTCCSESETNHPIRPALTDLLDEMLQTYPFPE